VKSLDGATAVDCRIEAEARAPVEPAALSRQSRKRTHPRRATARRELALPLRLSMTCQRRRSRAMTRNDGLSLHIRAAPEGNRGASSRDGPVSERLFAVMAGGIPGRTGRGDRRARIPGVGAGSRLPTEDVAGRREDVLVLAAADPGEWICHRGCHAVFLSLITLEADATRRVSPAPGSRRLAIATCRPARAVRSEGASSAPSDGLSAAVLEERQSGQSRLAGRRHATTDPLTAQPRIARMFRSACHRPTRRVIACATLASSCGRCANSS
jgi:hypothetical protein